MNDTKQLHAEGLSTFIGRRQAALEMSDAELATALGYSSPRVIAMIKAGTMKMPVNKVTALATALQADSREVLRLVVTEASPELWKVIQEVTAPLGALDEAETNLLRHLRQLRGGRVAKPIVFDGKGVVALVAVE